MGTYRNRRAPRHAAAEGAREDSAELHTFASWEGFLAATDAAAEAAQAASDAGAATAATATATAAKAAAGDREVEGDVAAAASAAAAAASAAAAAAEDNDTKSWSHYLLPPLRLVAHPHTPFTLPTLLLRQFSEAHNEERPVQQQQQQQHQQQQQQQQQQQHQRVGVMLAIGPEGGWVPPEMNLLQQQLRCLPFRLMDKVLKCETALVACLTQLTLCAEDPMFSPLLRSPTEVYAAATAAAAAAVAAAATAAAADSAAATAAATGGAAGAAAATAAATAAAADAAAGYSEHKEDKRRHRGDREVLRLAGGVLMTLPQRYVTRTAAADQK
ncbi:hypothetical protein Emed_007135 [Eimeria media]